MANQDHEGKPRRTLTAAEDPNSVLPPKGRLSSLCNMDIYSQKGNFYVSFLPVHLMNIAAPNTVKNNIIQFRAALTDFKDVVKPNWSTKTVYGRMDPIATFQRTERKINFTIDIVSESGADAKVNLKKIRRLQSYMYPTYADASEGFGILEAAPLMRIGFSNWTPASVGATDPAPIPAAAEDSDYTNYLLGYIDGDIGFAPDLKQPIFESWKGGTNTAASLSPSKMSLSISFNVLHEESVGWETDSDGKSSWRS